jgi:hypothetical protein
MFADAVSPPNRRVGEHQIKLTDLKETYQDSTGSSVLRSAQCGDCLPTLTPPLFISRAGELIDERHESAVGPGNDHRRASYLSATQPARGAILSWCKRLWVLKTHSQKSAQKNFALRSPTKDDRTSDRRFLSRKFWLFCEKRTFSTSTPDCNSYASVALISACRK